MIGVDNHKLQFHPERVAEWKKEGDCYPIYIEIGPTNNCNHNCNFCALDWVKSKKTQIKKEVMISNLEDMAMHGVKSVMFAGEGEPFLHKDTPLFVTKAKEYGMDVSITTNGTLFTKEKMEQCMPSLSWIRFSVDAGTPKTYSKIHGTKSSDFDKVIKNIRAAVRFKKKNNLETVIGAQFLLMPQNIDEVYTFAKLFKKIGVDNIQIKPYSQHPNSINKYIIEYKDYAHIEDKLKELNSDNFKVFFRKETMDRLDTTPYNECHGLPFFALIDANGNVMPCNLFYDIPKLNYGNINEHTFSQIWQGTRRRIVRKRLAVRGCDNCREGCRLDVINRYLNRIKNPEEHDNFL